jgi:hypothetical protein
MIDDSRTRLAAAARRGVLLLREPLPVIGSVGGPINPVVIK